MRFSAAGNDTISTQVEMKSVAKIRPAGMDCSAVPHVTMIPTPCA
jgi:hypothetical protein